MAKQGKQLIIALYDNEAAAQQAAEDLKAWDKANDDVKAGAVGVLVSDGKGGIKQDLTGPRAGGKGAAIGAMVGVGGGLLASRGREVDLPEGTVISLRLDRPLAVPRRDLLAYRR